MFANQYFGMEKNFSQNFGPPKRPDLDNPNLYQFTSCSRFSLDTILTSAQNQLVTTINMPYLSGLACEAWILVNSSFSLSVLHATMVIKNGICHQPMKAYFSPKITSSLEKFMQKLKDQY